MNTVSTTLVALSLSLVMVSPVFADHRYKGEYCHERKIDKIERRLHRQYHRIERGIDKDRLTHKEARKLKKRYRKISRLSREYREDGYLSRSEYRHLTRKLDKNSQLIREFMRNGIDRYIAYHDAYSSQYHDRYLRD